MYLPFQLFLGVVCENFLLYWLLSPCSVHVWCRGVVPLEEQANYRAAADPLPVADTMGKHIYASNIENPTKCK